MTHQKGYTVSLSWWLGVYFAPGPEIFFKFHQKQH
jgi:hypothetical protein